jgi:acyl-CoA thioesterase-1
MLIQDHDIVLFQGDSITDCGRSREDGNSLGTGYALFTAAQFSFLHPEKQVKFLNRGISGNRVVNLQQRWHMDCLELQPTVVSIFIGINDTWRKYDSNSPTSAEEFEEGYRDILTKTKEKLNARLILIEPFVLPVPADRKHWREDLDPKIHVVRDLAKEFGAALVPLDGIFAQASMKADYTYWAPDGVHPSPAGHALIAHAWLQAIE